MAIIIKSLVVLLCLVAISQTQIACGLHCLQCPSVGTCSSCQNGFFVVNQTFCAPCPIGCSSCNIGLNGFPICQSCISPAQLGINGICFTCDPICLTCQSIPINCTSCKDGFNLTTFNSSGICQPLIITCPIMNCNSCNIGQNFMPICEQCLPGFFSLQGQCYPCRFPCINCNLDVSASWVNISQFWSDIFANLNMSTIIPGVNISGMPPMPPLSNISFSNLTEQQMHPWVQGYFIIKTLQSFIPSSMTFSDLLTQAMAFYPTIQNLTQMQQQLAVLSRFNSLTGKNLTIEIIMTKKLQIIQNATTCSECNPGFQTDLMGKCVLCPLNCAICSAGTCTFCKLGFYLSSANCLPCNSPCGTCIGSADNCTSCLTPLLLSSGTCLSCADQCSSCSPTNTSNCLTCKIPYSLIPDSTGQCIRCFQDVCLQCDATNTSICLVCRNGSSLIDGRCQPCPSNCITCLLPVPPIPALCFQCSSGFTESNGTCVPCSPGCLSCFSSINCLQCQVGLFINASGFCQKCRQGCLSCTSQLLCNNFQDGIVVKDDMTIKCRQGCKVCDIERPDICTVCEQRYFLNSNICNSCQSGCQICSTSSICTKCIGNFILSSGNCLRCQGNCKTCDTANLSICLSCIRGTILLGSQCLANCPIGCLDCDPANTSICFKCDQGHALSPTAKCIKCLGSCSGSCDVRNISQCLSCVDGFELKSNQCIRCPQGCTTCLNSQCLSCVSQYKLTQNSLGSFTCLIKCRSPCAVCSGDFCLGCQAGFTYHNGMCHPDFSCNPSCSFCSRGTQKAANGSCVACPTNCSSCLNGQCSQCNQGMFLNGINQCVACPPECRTCFNNESCQRCSPGFVKQIVSMTNGITDALDQDKCIACDINCRSCIVQPDRCTSCFQGYRLMSYRCAGLFNVIYQYQLNLNYSQFLQNFESQSFVQAVSNMVGVNILDNYILSIIQGSVVVGGSISAQGQQNAQIIQKSLGSSVGNYPIISASSQVYYVDSPIVQPSQQLIPKSSVNIGMVIGIAIGALALVIIIGVTIYIIRKRKLSKTEIQTQQTFGDIDYKPANNTFGASELNIQPPNKSFIVQN